MKTKDLIRLGAPVGEPIALAHEFIQSFIAQGKDGALLEAEIFNIDANPRCSSLMTRRVRNSRRGVSGVRGSKPRR
jgi:hypothetical protein